MRWHNKSIIDKLAIGEQTCHGVDRRSKTEGERNLESQLGTSEHRQGWSREATEPLLTIKNNLNPERSEWVAETVVTH